MTETSASAAIFPALKYDDAPAAIDWLGRAFGFSKHMVVPDDKGGVAHAELRIGGAMIMLGSMGKPDPTNPWTTERQGVYVQITDIDEHYARAQAAGAKIERPLADTPYGAREYSVRDPGGHLWSFGTYDPFAPQE
ncbi:VOC family protein [Dongia sp.]|uniref:VOC family protein n=1 Tax=Dongia sp. TaxID=1977262 RepID=UPI0035B4AB27